MNGLEIMWLFLTYGFIGWLWETPYVSVKERRFVNRGFLRGPFIPIYGFAATTMVVLLNVFNGYVPIEGPDGFVAAMVFTAMVASVWEYLTSYGMEVAFGARWWDYSDRKFNLNGRIALVPSLFWGVGGFVLWYYVNPFVMQGVEMLFGHLKTVFLPLFYGILMLDTLLTLHELMSFRQLLEKTQQFSDRIMEYIEGKEGVAEWANELKEVVFQKAEYHKIEIFKDLGGLQEQVKTSLKTLKEQPIKFLEEWNQTFKRFKNTERFSKNYPHAQSKKVPMFFEVIRKRKSNL